VKPLCHVLKLDLAGCSNIKDVSSLTDVNDLTLDFCAKATETTHLLQNNVRVSLKCLFELQNVSSFKHVQYLNISGCYKVTNIDAIKNIPELHV